MATENIWRCHSDSLETIRLGIHHPYTRLNDLDHVKMRRIDRTLAQIENDLKSLTLTDSKYSQKLSTLIKQGQPPPKSNWVVRSGYKLKSSVSTIINSLHTIST